MLRFLILLFFINTAFAQSSQLHQFFTDQFNGSYTWFTYVENGQVKRELCQRVIGTYRHGLEAISLQQLRDDADNIPTACLAAQHFWMVFNVQQRAQAEVKAELALVKREQRRLRFSCIIDQPCSGLTGQSIINIMDYWVHFNAQELQTREDYILHFKTGLNGLEHILAWRNWLRYYRGILEQRRR